MKVRYGKLKKEWKAKWLKALRSGKYKQTEDNLMYIDDKGNRTYCCLGVLEEVVRERPLTSRRGTNSFPSDLVTKKALVAKSYDYDKYGYIAGYKKCANLNDTSGWSFKRIANWIEKNL